MSNEAHWTDNLTTWDTMVIQDDFTETVSTARWTTTATDSGTATTGDNAGGVLTVLPSDASVANNDEIYVATAKQPYLIAGGSGTGKPIYGRARMLFLEAGSNNASNVIFGFMSTVTANALVDDGGGPASATTDAVIYKVDGGTVWRCQSRNGSEYTDTISTLTASDTAYHLFEVIIKDYTPTRCQITYKVDGQFLKDSVYNKPIVHQLLVASAAQMSIFFGMKNGETTTVETLLVDRAYASQLR